MDSYIIPVLLGTTRNENQSMKAAKYLHHQLLKFPAIESYLLDLGQADFPILTERVTPENQITTLLEEWTEIIRNAHGLIIVSPEYKGGYPGSLKNFLDYLPAGIFRYKPVGICTVSSGIYAGTSCLQQLRQVVISMAGLVIPDRMQIGTIQNAFDNNNQPISDQIDKVAHKFLSETINYSKALQSLQID